MEFSLEHTDKSSKARSGRLTTARNSFETPVFMPVATQATVKGVTSRELADSGVEMIISNAYHLYMRPGKELIQKYGGLHSFMGWDGSITTDSGGFQVFSLAELSKIKEEGVEFRSHLDGSKHFFSPEMVVDLQLALGSDILMPLDECVRYPAPRDYVEDSVALTLRWAERSRDRFRRADPLSALFGIVQGSTYKDMRQRSAESTVELDMDGYALGGIAVGESGDLISEITEHTVSFLPVDKPRYLMGVGTPVDMLEAIASGVDMFDCVVPTRNGRNGQAFTFEGEKNLKNASFKEDSTPIDTECRCFACRNHTRGYIRHLFNASEMNGPRLVSMHNIYFYTNLIRLAREAIKEDRFDAFRDNFVKSFRRG